MKFLLETDSVSSSANEIGNIATSVADIAHKVSGYAVEDTDGFNFSGAKRQLASCINTCAERVKNTGAIMNNGISIHTELQNSLTLENYLNPKTEEDKKSDDAGRGPGGPTTNRRHKTDDGASGLTEGTIIESPIIDQEQEDKKHFEELKKIIGKNKEYSTKKLAYANIVTGSLSSVSKKVLATMDTNTDGYARIANRYVIACPATVGLVGEVLRFTSSDGRIVECVVGVNTVTKENNDKVFLLIGDKSKVKPSAFDKILGDNKTKVVNIGTYDDKKIENKTNIDIVPDKETTNTNTVDSTTDTNNKIDTNTDSKADIDASTQTDTDTNAKTDTNTDVKTDTDANAKADTNTEVKTDTDANTKTDTSTDVKTDADANAKADTNTEVKTDTDEKENTENENGDVKYA